MEWGDYNTAAKIRDLIRGIVNSTVDRERPSPRYASVDSVNLTGKTASVTYSGEAVSVPVPFGGTIPSVGARVRIEGPPGARYIADVDNIPWVAPTLSGAWVNYGSTYAPAGYMRDKLGFVHLRGLVKSGAIGTIFTLPVGYRPAYDIIIGAPSNSVFGEAVITTAGLVKMDVGNTAWFTLEGITFRAEA